MPTTTWPASTGTVTSAKAITVPAGTTFDGKMQTYERSDITCKGQVESGKETAMFIVEPGATLKNVIIGKNQMEGVHCEQHDCTIENVWWSDVCEDALTIKGGSSSSVTRVIGGGAQYADDKIVQHNGAGTVSIDGFYALDFGKLYRSCGTCGAIQRNVIISNVFAVNPAVSIATVNSNFGDVATLRNIRVQTTKKDVKICEKTIGTSGGEPSKVDNGPDGTVCKYSPSDIVINGASFTTTDPLPATVSPPDGPAVASPVPKMTPATASRSQAVTPTPVPMGALQPQLASTDIQSPGRVQVPLSFPQLPSEGAAASLNPQSLSFAQAPTPTVASSTNSFGFRGFGIARGLRG